MDNKPIAVDEAQGKNSIKINIEGIGTHTLTHSMHGNDGRITLSYTIPTNLQQEWKDHRHQIVKVELRDIK